MEGLQPGTIMTLLTGLLVGVAFGFVLQRGRYCMNSAFRDIIFINDFTLFRAYILALVIAILGANLLEDLGYMGEGLRRQAFAPMANIIGGYVFGIGIVLAGGCGSGILYRVGEGLLNAWMATLGFAFGIIMTMHGVLKPVYTYLKGFKVEINDTIAPALWDLFGGGQYKWIVIAVLVLAALPFILQDKPFKPRKQKGYYWSVTGLLIGVIAVIAWWASVYWGGNARGLSFTGPTADFFMAVLTRDSRAPADPMFNFWGLFNSTWSAIYVIGVPLGAYLSARALGEFKWNVPPAKELLRTFLGSLIMGFGAAVGGGCNIGHGLTGVSSLAISSIVATIFIILGNWTMVYFMFIKPMKD